MSFNSLDLEGFGQVLDPEHHVTGVTAPAFQTPEPASLVLLTLGGGGMGVWYLRCRQARQQSSSYISPIASSVA